MFTNNGDQPWHVPCAVQPGEEMTSSRSALSLQGSTMNLDFKRTDRLRHFIEQIRSLTRKNELHWERRVGSAHRYARFNENLLILGPATPVAETTLPRYLFVTPFDSPEFIEINSNDAHLGECVSALMQEVEAATESTPATDPFAISIDLLEAH